MYYHANTSTADNENIEVALRVVGNNVHVFYEGLYRGSKEINITGAGKAGIGFGRMNNSQYTSYDLGQNCHISKFEIYELPDSLFDGSDSVHYIENGKLGIGTTSPTKTLHVISKSSGDGIRISTSQDISVATLYNTNSESFPVGALSLQYGSTNAGLISGQSNRLNIRGGGSSGGSISFASHTTEMMRLTSTGLGIGTTNPDHLLHVSGNAKMSNIYLLGNIIHEGDVDTQIKFATDTITFDTAGSERLTINSTGNVGIGTTTPYATLTVAGNITQTENSHLISTRKITARDAAGLSLYNDGGEGIDIKDSGDIKISADKSIFSDGSITMKIDYNNNQTDRVFNIIGDNSTEVFRVQENGRVGIGTTSPQQLLDITDTDAAPVLRLSRNQNIGGTSWAGESGDIEFYTNDGSSPNVFGKISVVGGGESGTPNVGYPDGHMVFYTRGQQGGNTLSERLRITDEGDVGIGTTSPAAKLDVRGTISQTVDAATNQYPLSFYNSHAGTNFYLLRQRVVNTGNQVRTGLGITGVPSCAFEIGTKTDQILRFTTSGTISNVSTINGNNPLKINATEIRTGDTSGSLGANFNIVGDNNRVPLGIKQESGASQDRFITFRNSSNITKWQTLTLGIVKLWTLIPPTQTKNT